MPAVARLGDHAYGVTIRRETEERTGRPVSVGALYATIARLWRTRLVDPPALLGGTGVLLAAALMATLPQARRATQVEPTRILRED